MEKTAIRLPSLAVMSCQLSYERIVSKCNLVAASAITTLGLSMPASGTDHRTCAYQSPSVADQGADRCIPAQGLDQVVRIPEVKHNDRHLIFLAKRECCGIHHA